MAAKASESAGLAERYASALYELADERRSVDTVAEDLRRLRTMLSDSPDLDRLVRSPVLSRDQQGKAIAAISEQAGFDALTRNFLGLLARNRRLFAVTGMIAAFLAELARRRGELTAHVTSAAPLSESQLATVTDSLRRAVGGKVSVDLSVDPSLLGGLVVRVGSRMVDSSLRTKLQRLELAMKGVA
ncbi:ATP synthase F1 subcomplex delta subunit [Stella humosa]|uniref:ATP synthase subunit delta n=1 Tax=Stella humosa TaxID=94 RepID=A0A3N1KVL4_9PROT|nr:F0F1 ATP synthase subunit delta [Stella humosa]ROP84631.1 ATP synthase F1 subcomplex delta subunit [Stella humosa]BBK34151.1 ATP synthase subunit delta [Stella humosa]